jgi:hypothetical protein
MNGTSELAHNARPSTLNLAISAPGPGSPLPPLAASDSADARQSCVRLARPDLRVAIHRRDGNIPRRDMCLGLLCEKAGGGRKPLSSVAWPQKTVKGLGRPGSRESADPYTESGRRRARV